MMFMYMQDNDGKLPPFETWSDTLEETFLKDPRVLICPGAKKQGRSGRSNYGMNPNCKPDSPPRTVLAFETDDGWNKYGGPELLIFDHHKDTKRKYATILYLDGSAERIEPNEVDKLNWGAPDDN